MNFEFSDARTVGTYVLVYVYQQRMPEISPAGVTNLETYGTGIKDYLEAYNYDGTRPGWYGTVRSYLKMYGRLYPVYTCTLLYRDVI